MRIYIAGPYSADTPEEIAANVRAMIDAQIELIKMRHQPLNPLLNHWTAIRAHERDIEIDYDEWLRTDLAWVERADAVLLLAHSPGADREVEHAQKKGIPVYHGLREVPR